MFARTATFQWKLDKLDEAIKLYEDYVVPAVKSQKGFRSIYLLADRTTGNIHTVSLWDSEEEMKDTEQRDLTKEWIAKFNEYYTESPTTANYEVRVQG